MLQRPFFRLSCRQLWRNFGSFASYKVWPGQCGGKRSTQVDFQPVALAQAQASTQHLPCVAGVLSAGRGRYSKALYMSACQQHKFVANSTGNFLSGQSVRLIASGLQCSLFMSTGEAAGTSCDVDVSQLRLRFQAPGSK